MYELGSHRSTIREIFEYGNQRAAIVGRENVLDFSLGNPNVPAPDEVRQAILAEAAGDPVAIHGYTSAPGAPDVRRTLADSLNRRFGTDYTGDSLYLTAGAAAALMCAFRALACEGDEFVVFAPFFPEYKMFIESGAGAKCVLVPPSIEDFQIDFDAFAQRVSEHTKAVVINSPNNPSGAVYSEQTIRRLAEFLREKENEYGHPIYLISDEPYREIVYDNVTIPFVPNYYDDTIVCYSYSKSLSLPGERIGYVYVPGFADDSAAVYAAVSGAARVMGHVCPPTLMQKVIQLCAGERPDLAAYDENRNLLYNSLREMGYECAKPDGAFYLFVKAPNGDANAFSEKAKLDYNLLVVPGTGFECPGFVRLSYCVSNDMIRRSRPSFRAMMKECR